MSFIRFIASFFMSAIRASRCYIVDQYNVSGFAKTEPMDFTDDYLVKTREPIGFKLSQFTQLDTAEAPAPQTTGTDAPERAADHPDNLTETPSTGKAYTLNISAINQSYTTSTPPVYTRNPAKTINHFEKVKTFIANLFGQILSAKSLAVVASVAVFAVLVGAISNGSNTPDPLSVLVGTDAALAPHDTASQLKTSSIEPATAAKASAESVADEMSTTFASTTDVGDGSTSPEYMFVPITEILATLDTPSSQDAITASSAEIATEVMERARRSSASVASTRIVMADIAKANSARAEKIAASQTISKAEDLKPAAVSAVKTAKAKAEPSVSKTAKPRTTATVVVAFKKAPDTRSHGTDRFGFERIPGSDILMKVETL